MFAQAGIVPRVRTNSRRGWLSFSVSTAKIRKALREQVTCVGVKNRLYQMLLVRKRGLR